MCYSIILQTHPRPLLSVSNLQSRKLSQHVSENVFIHFLLAVYSVLFQLWAFVCIFYLVSLPCLKYSIVSLHFFRFFLRSPRSPFFSMSYFVSLQVLDQSFLPIHSSSFTMNTASILKDFANNICHSHDKDCLAYP